MFRNVLLITVRNMRRYKLYSAINIAGLSVGIACCLMIGLLIEDELRFDRFHRYADRIYRFSTGNRPSTHAHLGPKLVADFPDIEHAVRIMRVSVAGTTIAYRDRKFTEEELLYATSNFFDVFSFPLVLGDPGTALASPDAIVISQDMAKRCFGDVDPLGKALAIHAGKSSERTVRVTGVLGELPRHTHFSFHGLVPYAAYPNGEWENGTAYTYLILGENALPGELAEKISFWLPHQFTPDDAGDKSASRVRRSRIPCRLMPLTDIHLHSHLEQELGLNRDIKELYVFGSVGFLVLLIACANYMNLATARSANRAREVGLRKVVGADRWQLMRQFQGEAVLVAVLAFAAGVMLTEMFLPILNAVVGRTLSITYGGRFLCTLGVGVLIVGLLSGSYPAFFLTRFRPTAMMKDLSRSMPRSAGFRKGLIVFQFAVAIGLIGATIVVMRQLHFTKNKDLGFESRDVVILDSSKIDYDVYSAEHRFGTIKDELRRNPSILKVSLAFVVPGEDFWTGTEFKLIDVAESKPTRIKTMYIDQDYLETLGIDLIAGQSFKSAFATRSYNGVILNESAAREMGIGRTTGQKVHMNLGNVVETDGTIVGIVRDFHIRSLHHKIEPLALRLHLDKVGVGGHGRYLVARLRPQNVPATLQFLRDKLAEFAPSQHFRYTFLDTYFDFDELYQNETRLMRVFGTFSGLAIFLAFLGLFGLAHFTTENRTREIGIRKVLGASVFNVVSMMSRDFVFLVIIAIVIAWPVAYIGAEALLRNFAYRVDVGWWTVPLSGALALGLALLTVGWQAGRAARANPADVLRHE
ncbi:MAG: ABC transporter permease [Gemmatimonadota bacterium]|nr:ABC transporter permease [Gemmatimonadota bacterium]